LIIGAAAALLALGGLTAAVLRSQSHARGDAVARLDVRSRVSGQLLSGTLALSFTQSTSLAQQRLADAAPTRASLDAWNRATRSQALYTALLDAKGRTLVSTPAGASAPSGGPEQAALQDAMGGHAGVTGILHAGSTRVVELLVPYDAGAAGRRVLVSAVPAQMVQPFLAGTLAGATGTRHGGAFVLDRDGSTVASVGAPAADAALRHAVGAAARAGRTSGSIDAEHYAIEPIAGTRWVVALVARDSELAASLPSTLWPRLALAAFGLALLLVALLSARAISASRHLEEARRAAVRANDSKSRFLTHISHELKQPLAAIMGFSDILIQRTDLGEADRRHFLGIISKSGRNLEQLVNELLDISRIESGRVLLNLERVDVPQAVEEVFALDEALAADRHIRLELSNACPADTRAVADPVRLRQVLLNLLSNAIKYNRESGVATVRLEPTERGTVRVSVMDEGAGIDESDMHKLFHPFERLREQRGPQPGTGLGLVITKGLVEAMNGTLDVASVVGAGTAFSFELAMDTGELELLDAPRDDGDGVRRRLADERARKATGHVLYVEDDPANLELVENILTRERPGLTLHTATDGSSGAGLAEQKRPDLLLLDLNLPDMTGEQVLRRLRARPDTADVPVIIMSSDASSLSVTRLLETGADAYVTKPIDVRRFLGTLDVLISRHAACAPHDGGSAGDDKSLAHAASNADGAETPGSAASA
jgi:signal transduction histidine kinase/CheY-like chemotaxis protein